MVDRFYFQQSWPAPYGDPDRPLVVGAVPNPDTGETGTAADGDVARNAGLRSDGELVQAVSETLDATIDALVFDAIL